MNFLVCLFLPHGRLARISWLYRLVSISFLGAAIGMLLNYLAGETGAALVALMYLWVAGAMSTQRLHDSGRSGWILLTLLVPVVGPIFLLFQLASKGAEGPNRYGHDPLSRANYLTVDITR
ncbi:DUF805 domain-containing protein [Herbaspirillum sp.]|uniref:DUF805 domain-containing protein n=1 Tax=Herbaspirillum TaxID=963 RepID=UPI00258A561A|nr:DUF805 domain-containing protein [Herbaspirillum sp.]MCP3654218.1 DUF805 domain-containing protein [Herbaspirillum sp.]MCP3947371.1 DUF805 domain-containing protein [Herbaspirillum sp.]MCP4031747.1 DUF805 domain-containing protein [Herbaspirillum sp.]MCP4555124.1 DUF805 domain-containing protein [Herbaspirillum sp.]